jgi:hypothetical protein
MPQAIQACCLLACPSPRGMPPASTEHGGDGWGTPGSSIHLVRPHLVFQDGYVTTQV